MSKMIVAQGVDIGGGDYVMVTLTNGRVVIVWDDSVNNAEGENAGAVEVHASLEAIEQGELPLSSTIVN